MLYLYVVVLRCVMLGVSCHKLLVIFHQLIDFHIFAFLKEQWHQKLHNNTTPADIGICRAIIAYLRSGGDMGTYWRVLGEHGITKDGLH